MGILIGRRKLLGLMGLTSLAVALPKTVFGKSKEKSGDLSPELKKTTAYKYRPISPSFADEVRLSPDLEYRLLVSEGESIGNGIKFGACNDFNAFLGNGENSGYLWTNHESVNPYLFSKYRDGGDRTKLQVDNEKKMVGGSYYKIKKEKGWWKVDSNTIDNFRVDATTPIPLISDRPIRGSKNAVGSLANCSGGTTPWGTILTCEENYDGYAGEYVYELGKHNPNKIVAGKYGWQPGGPMEPEHYGWVVEVDPKTKSSKKLTSIGRFAHECATVVQAKDGRCVVYTGDDTDNECLYKFVASKKGSLEEGELFVANMKKGRWESLRYDKQKKLRKKFEDQTEVLIRCREASKIVGGSPLDRPEDIEVHPKDGSILVALTNNKSRLNYSGSILQIFEKDGDYLSDRFEHKTFLTGGKDMGFACPDNLAFDKSGDLWFTTDISEGQISKFPYEYHGNNALFHVPMSGHGAGIPVRVATAPVDSEFTGPCFSDDGETLFLSVQHPGNSATTDKMTSHWPNGGKSEPKSSVIQIRV
ncbi:MAG: DUF839 domain-containing protein [Bdellovibrionales bacterium]|nr:DUF839 domain-containing protein [Bdellovibrionales bacterium]